MDVPAGWYPDPGGQHAQRYWDGTVWTRHVAGADGQTALADVLPPPPVGAPGGRSAREFDAESLLTSGARSVQSAANFITGQLGLDKVDGFSPKRFFSEVFRRHDPDEVEAEFSVGSKALTPELNESMGQLPNPWLFFRVLVSSLAVYGLFVIGWTEFQNINLLPGLIIIGSFAVPGAVLVFFFEINTPRNISLVRVIQFLMLGGVISLLLSLLMFEMVPLLGVFGAPAAGIVEEIGKLAAVVLAMRMIPAERYPYRLNAMLFGAAVGTGFAAFESAGYALQVGLFNVDGMLTTITMRGLLSPFGHIPWTVIAVTAYWVARREHDTLTSALSSRRFLILFSVPVVLHAIWNTPFVGPFFAKYWALGFVTWVIVLSLIQAGLHEVGEAARTGAAGSVPGPGGSVPPAPPAATPSPPVASASDPTPTVPTPDPTPAVPALDPAPPAPAPPTEGTATAPPPPPPWIAAPPPDQGDAQV